MTSTAYFRLCWRHSRNHTAENSVGKFDVYLSTLVCTGLLTGVEGLKTDGVAVGGAWFCLLCDVANRVKSEVLK